MKKFAIGVDFGTLSGRAVLVDISNGEEVAASVFDYPHAVMDKSLPDGTILPNEFALQHPQDYIDVLKNTIPTVIKEGNISNEQVVGLGIDFTACTLLPVLMDSTPLCTLDEYNSNPYSYVKLWKHHGAIRQSEKFTQVAKDRNEKFLPLVGSTVSPEFLFPKMLETLEKCPEIYEKAAYFIEAGDWVVWQLCGNLTRSRCLAGYKSMWNKKLGYPSKEYLKEVNEKLENCVEEKLKGEMLSIWECAGGITSGMAQLTGLKEGTPVAAANIDAHAALPAVGINKNKQLMLILGTSSCHIMLGNKECGVKGTFGVVEDSLMPDYFAYEAGQPCVGDCFDWFVKNLVPKAYFDEASANNMNIHAYLRQKASQLEVGQSGLVALDWWNGNRSILLDSDLTGLIIGMTMATKPEEIYRALIEATAFGTRIIIENYKEHGLDIEEIYAAGGIAAKDEMMMQIYSDVTNMDIKIAKSSQAPALGSAMYGAVAGKAYNSIFDAVDKMGKVRDKIYHPNPKNVQAYEKLFVQYKKLHDFFAKSDIMKELKKNKNL